jgi:hypothetical protein
MRQIVEARHRSRACLSERGVAERRPALRSHRAVAVGFDLPDCGGTLLA